MYSFTSIDTEEELKAKRAAEQSQLESQRLRSALQRQVTETESTSSLPTILEKQEEALALLNQETRNSKGQVKGVDYKRKSTTIYNSIDQELEAAKKAHPERVTRISMPNEGGTVRLFKQQVDIKENVQVLANGDIIRHTQILPYMNRKGRGIVEVTATNRFGEAIAGEPGSKIILNGDKFPIHILPPVNLFDGTGKLVSIEELAATKGLNDRSRDTISNTLYYVNDNGEKRYLKSTLDDVQRSNHVLQIERMKQKEGPSNTVNLNAASANTKENSTNPALNVPLSQEKATPVKNTQQMNTATNVAEKNKVENNNHNVQSPELRAKATKLVKTTAPKLKKIDPKIDIPKRLEKHDAVIYLNRGIKILNEYIDKKFDYTKEGVKGDLITAITCIGKAQYEMGTLPLSFWKKAIEAGKALDLLTGMNQIGSQHKFYEFEKIIPLREKYDLREENILTQFKNNLDIIKGIAQYRDKKGTSLSSGIRKQIEVIQGIDEDFSKKFAASTLKAEDMIQSFTMCADLLNRFDSAIDLTPKHKGQVTVAKEMAEALKGESIPEFKEQKEKKEQVLDNTKEASRKEIEAEIDLVKSSKANSIKLNEVLKPGKDADKHLKKLATIKAEEFTVDDRSDAYKLGNDIKILNKYVDKKFDYKKHKELPADLQEAIRHISSAQEYPSLNPILVQKTIEAANLCDALSGTQRLAFERQIAGKLDKIESISQAKQVEVKENQEVKEIEKPKNLSVLSKAKALVAKAKAKMFPPKKTVVAALNGSLKKSPPDQTPPSPRNSGELDQDKKQR